MTITAFELLTEEQLKPFIHHSQLGNTLRRVFPLIKDHDLTANEVEKLADAVYWIIEDYKTLMASEGLSSIIKQFNLPFDPEDPASATPLEALEALSDIREDEPDRHNGEAIEHEAEKILREIYRPGVNILEEATSFYDLSEITSAPELIFFVYAAEELATALAPSKLGEISDLSRLAFAALEALEAINHAEKLIIYDLFETQRNIASLQLQKVKESQTRGYRSSLAIICQAKSETRAIARTIAEETWQNDTDHEYRLKDMAGVVEDHLKSKGYTDLPKRERIKEWLKPIAPDYARRPGRERKSPRT